MYKSAWWLLPTITVAWSMLSFGVCYAIARLNQHVRPLPRISDTGDHFPESRIFAQLLNIAALLGFLIMYLRYELISAQLSQLHQNRTARVLNICGLCLAGATSLGLSLLANFSSEEANLVHVIGASMAMFLGVLYTVTQTALTYAMGKFIFRGRWYRVTLASRSVLALLSTAFGVTFLVTYVIEEIRGKTRAIDLINPVAEWALAMIFLVLYLTFIPEFGGTKFRMKVRVLEEGMLSQGSSASNINAGLTT